MTTTTSMQATDYHRLPMRVANTLWRTMNMLGLGRIKFDPDAMMAQARQETGLDDFGADSFLEPMHVLVKSLEEEADLNPVGRFIAKSNFLRLLKGRLYTADLLTRHPEILERRMPDPVVIVGLARSGTTRLHRLLAADDRFLHLKSWESVYPVPYPECFEARSKGEADPRIAVLEQGLKGVLYLSPQISAVHPLGTFEVEEEIGPMQYAFSTQLFEVQARIPTFTEWLMTHDQFAAYEYMRDCLKIIAWWRGDPEDKPWILKSPQHMQDLNSLMHAFPGAKLICPHRDPIKVVGSCCSMTWNAIVRDSNSVTPQWVGQEWLNKVDRMVEKNLREREQLVPPENQHDIRYADITADWQQAMLGIYQFLDMPLTDQAKTSMQAWLDSNKQHKHGAHKYHLADFGLDEKTVEERMSRYRQRFNIPRETKNPHL